MKVTNTVRFFEGLAQRMYHENDLSDMVYALCFSNSQFKQFFLDFFFEGQGLKAENVSIEREVSYPDGSRPDFVIRAEGKIYFVEVKIWDRNHHFAQYANTLERLSQKDWVSQLGYIANYTINVAELNREDKEGKTDELVFDRVKKNVRQWKDFIASLKSSEHSSWNNSEEVQGLIAYCEKVCPDISDEEISAYSYVPEHFRQVKSFYESLQKFLSNQLKIEVCNSTHVIQLDKYRVANTPAESIGYYFGAVDETKEMAAEQKLFSGKKIWGWVGLRLKKKHLGLCIAFDNIEGWGKLAFDVLKNNSAWLPFCFAPPLSDGEYDRVFTDAFRTVFEKLICCDLNQYDISQKIEDVRELPYYVIRSLPLFIRQKVFPNLEIMGCRISPFFQKDTCNPSGWCGEYFSVTKIPQKEGEFEKEVGRFWVGTYYDVGREDRGIVCEQIGGSIEPLITYDQKGQNVNVDSFCKAINQFVSKCVNGKCNAS